MMSNARFRQVHQGLTTTAKKVYELIPIGEPWDYHQITAEVTRAGLGIQYNILQGCVAALVDAQLVDEPRRGHFQRAPIKDKPMLQAVERTEKTTMTMQPIVTKAAATPLERLGELAVRIRKFGDDAKAMATTLADELENAVLEFEEQQDMTAADVAKFKTLKAVLKDLGQ
jgi:hypothetical protein